MNDFKFTLVQNTLRTYRSYANNQLRNYDVINRTHHKQTNTFLVSEISCTFEPLKNSKQIKNLPTNFLLVQIKLHTNLYQIIQLTVLNKIFHQKQSTSSPGAEQKLKHLKNQSSDGLNVPKNEINRKQRIHHPQDFLW